ncbi:MAG: hypothetical protein IT208_01775 [Chthonomonadales bacterium]|nr:hypothetical protein [Chthonomonadales bacterium]
MARWRAAARAALTCVAVLCVVAAAGAAPMGGGSMGTADDMTTVTLNGLQIALDSRTGAIRHMAYQGPGELLDADAGEAGLVDAAYPIETFEPLRLSARHARSARIERSPDRVVVRIDALGPSRDGMAIEGAVEAVVTLRADPDGRSIVLTCELANHTPRPLRQVVFPELRGLRDVAGPDNTIFKTCGLGSAPFRELVVPEADQWYGTNSSTIEHKSGGMFHSMWTRWMDLGGLPGGFSLFPRRWSPDPHTTTVLQLRQATRRLRLLCLHAGDVAPGARWSSGEWVLTPHRSGWAKGIEPYRAWVRAHAKRRYSMPRRIRESLGYRSLWMCQNQPADPTDVVWRFSDLPGLAREARDHGLAEMVMWASQPLFDASLPAPYPHLGTEADLLTAAAECRQIGVPVVPFVSVLQASPRTAGRYGLKVLNNNGWTYHTEMLPRWNPPYATGLSCVQVGPANAAWQDEVAASLRRWADRGLTDVSWDQYWTGAEKPTMQDLTARVRDYARSLDAESSFSGEELWDLEVDCEYLDYTWNWGTYRDCQAFVNAFPAPRPNVNINRSVVEARFAFMDNLFLNVWPSKPDGINGSERIANVPELSRTLKTCAALRRRFLRYFTEGTLIGNCLLTEPAPGVRLSAYVLPDRVLAIVLNQGPDADLSFRYDLAPWLPDGKAFSVARVDEALRAEPSADAPVSGSLEAGRLRHLEMRLLEFTPR